MQIKLFVVVRWALYFLKLDFGAVQAPVKNRWIINSHF